MAEKTNGHAGAAGKPKGKAASMSKADALRRALSDLSKDAMPVQLQAHIKDKFGIEMTTSHISASKTNIVRKMVGGAKSIPAKSPAKSTVAPKPAATTAVAPKPTTKKSTSTKPATTQPQAKPAPAASSNGKASGTVALADVQTVNTLVGRVGATDLKTLIDLLAK